MTQKLILVQDRNDNYHLIDFCAPSGRKYTLCNELVYYKRAIINTFTLDDMFDGVCSKCKEIFDSKYSVQALGNRLVKGSLRESLTQKYGEARTQTSDKEMNYLDSADRIWDKLSRYKRKLKVDRRK